MREAASPEASGCILGGSWRSTVRISLCPTYRGAFFEPDRGSDEGCQPAFRVGPTVGPLSVSDRSKCYLVLLKMPRKLLTLRSLQTCQRSGVGSIPIGRSMQSSTYRLCFLRVGTQRNRTCFRRRPNQLNHLRCAARFAGVRACAYTSSVNLLFAWRINS